jgi:hypothetical protein
LAVVLTLMVVVVSAASEHGQGESPSQVARCEEAKRTHRVTCEAQRSLDHPVCKHTAEMVFEQCVEQKSESLLGSRLGMTQHLALVFSGLPTEDPVLGSTLELGESLREGHVRDMMQRIDQFHQAHSKLVREARDVAQGKVEYDKSRLDPTFNMFYAAAERMHMRKLSSVGYKARLGASKRKAPLAMNSKTLFRRLQRVVKKAKSKGLKVGNAAMGEEQRRRFLGEGWGIAWAIKKVKGLFSSLGIDKVFGYIKSLASSFIKSVINMIKKGLKAMIQLVMRLPAFQRTMKKLTWCTDPEGLVSEVKCSGGTLTKLPPGAKKFGRGQADDGKMKTCSNGGGTGQSWLWLERVNMRKPPSTWLKAVPDSTEWGSKQPCRGEEQANSHESHDHPLGRRSLGEGKGKLPTLRACKMTGSDYCVNRFKDQASVDPLFCNQLHPPGELRKKCLSGLPTPSFWRNFKLEEQKTKCEGDGRCKLVKIEGAPQGMYKCVPLVRHGDPRFAPRETVGEMKRGKNNNVRHKATQAEKKKMAAWRHNTTQYFQAQWQRAVHPFKGGPEGALLAVYDGAEQFELAKAYIRTGDYCINYKKDKDGNLPSNRVRCLSQQFHFGTDAFNWVLCMGIDPAGMGRWIVDRVFRPVINMLPGPLGKSMLGPAIKDMIGGMLGVALDQTIQNIPILGIIYDRATHFLNLWFGIDIRNILTQRRADELIGGNIGLYDFAIDATQERMKAVYATKPGVKCDEKKLSGLECMTSIPIRQGIVTGARRGDYTASGPLSSMWPGRNDVNVGVQNMRVAYIKTGMCLQIPVCDTALLLDPTSPKYGSFYKVKGRQVTARDCGGNGQCRWNRHKGNHCVCDKGYSGALCKRDSAAGVQTVVELGDAMSTGEGWIGGGSPPPPDVKKAMEATKNAKAMSKSAKAMSKGGKNAPVTRRRRWYSRRSSRRRRKGSSTGCNGWTPSKGKWKGKGGFCARFGWTRKWCYTNKDFKGPGHEFIKPSESSPGKFYLPCKTVKKSPPANWGPPPPSTGVSFKEMFTHPQMKMTGPKDISEKCRKAKNCSKEPGCVSSGRGCTDASHWDCASQKKILDCVAYRDFAPAKMSSFFDKACGRRMLEQKPKEFVRCMGGIRDNHSCNTDQDCPSGGLGHKKACPNGKCRCKKVKAVIGCIQAVIFQCSEMGYNKIAGMAV